MRIAQDLSFAYQPTFVNYSSPKIGNEYIHTSFFLLEKRLLGEPVRQEGRELDYKAKSDHAKLDFWKVEKELTDRSKDWVANEKFWNFLDSSE